MAGKNLRLNRFRYAGSRNGLIVPLDHGLTIGPVPGLKSIREIARWITHPAICGVIAHKGMAERLSEARLLDGVGLMVHLNGMSTLAENPDAKVLLTTVEAAARLGADAVSFQVNFTGANDARNMELMGSTVDEAARFGLPVLAMVYDKVECDDTQSVLRLQHLMRIALELGVDALKIAPPQSHALLPEILAGIAEDLPVLLAGGTLGGENQVYELAHLGLRAGAAGLCVGRNVFQRENFSEVLSRLEEILCLAGPHIREVPFSKEIAYGPH